MSDTVKLVIDFPNDKYELFVECYRGNDNCDWLYRLVAEGIPLDDVKAEVLNYNVRKHVSGSESFLMGYAVGMDKSAEILDNIGKESEE